MNIEKGKKILVTGASGDLGLDFLSMIKDQELYIGAQYHSNKEVLENINGSSDIKLFRANLDEQATSHILVDDFVEWAGGIDCLVQLSGALSDPIPWDQLTQEQWQKDLDVNVTAPFFLAQRAMKYMSKSGGKIILCSTASACHGGGSTSMAYGAAKAAIECITKGLARVGAEHNILVNAIAPGFIKTKFHTDQMKRSERQIKERAQMVLLKRAGEPRDVSGMITYLLSEFGDYITGEVFPISGGDWL